MLSIFKNYMNLIMIYHFLPESMKIKKVKKSACNLHNRTEYVIHIGSLKQTLNHGLVLKKVHRLIKFK